MSPLIAGVTAGWRSGKLKSNDKYEEQNTFYTGEPHPKD